MKKERETNTNTETQTETQNADTQTTTQTQTQTPPKIKQPNVLTEGETGAERGAWLHTDKTVIEISSDTTDTAHTRAHTNAHTHNKKSNRKKQPASARKCLCVCVCCYLLFVFVDLDRCSLLFCVFCNRAVLHVVVL